MIFRVGEDFIILGVLLTYNSFWKLVKEKAVTTAFVVTNQIIDDNVSLQIILNKCIIPFSEKDFS